MKNYLITSLLFLSLGFSQKEYNYNDIIEMNNGLWTEKFSDEPITGKVYHSTGKIYGETTFKDGKKDGLWTQWDENGQKRFEVTYKDGKNDGLWTQWYENGQKKYEGTYKDGNQINTKCWDEEGNECE